MFRFIIEYSSLRDFYGPLCNNNNRSIFKRGFLKDDIMPCVETLVIELYNILKDFGSIFEDYIFAW